MKHTFNNHFEVLKLNTNIEEVFLPSKNPSPDLYSMLWVTKGMVDLSVDDVLIPINANQMTFITPLEHVQVLENHGEVNIIQFNRAFYCIKENHHEVSCNGILYFGTQGIPMIDLVPKEIKSFGRLLDALEEEFEIIDTIQEEMLRVILKKWLIKSTRILKKQNNFIGKNGQKTELVRQFKILLEQFYKKHHKVRDYARLLNKSPKTIANQFKLSGQESPSVMIQQRIIIEAKRYLLYTPLSIKEIAFKLGFDDAPSFSHYFKNKTNISPLHFRGIYQKFS